MTDDEINDSRAARLIDMLADKRRQAEAERDRLRQVLNEAREAINIAVRILPRAWLTGSSVSFAEWEAGWQKVDAALVRIHETLGDG